MVVVNRTAKLELQPIVTIACCQTLHDAKSGGNRLLRIGVHVDTNVTHIVSVVKIGEGVDIEECSRVESGVEHESNHTIPVAVDVLGLGDTTTGLAIICGLV